MLSRALRPGATVAVARMRAGERAGATGWLLAIIGGEASDNLRGCSEFAVSGAGRNHARPPGQRTGGSPGLRSPGLPPVRYPITSVTWSSTCWGIVRPSAWAVL